MQLHRNPLSVLYFHFLPTFLCYVNNGRNVDDNIVESNFAT
jgi:hypothetical protein